MARTAAKVRQFYLNRGLVVPTPSELAASEFNRLRLRLGWSWSQFFQCLQVINRPLLQAIQALQVGECSPAAPFQLVNRADLALIPQDRRQSEWQQQESRSKPRRRVGLRNFKPQLNLSNRGLRTFIFARRRFARRSVPPLRKVGPTSVGKNPTPRRPKCRRQQI